MKVIVDQAEILRRLNHEYQRFRDILTVLSPEQIETPGVVGDWSIKDVIAHFIIHEQFALLELGHARRDERFTLDESGAATMNDFAVATGRAQSLSELLHLWDLSYIQMVEAVQSLSDSDFDPSGPVVQALDDTIDGALANNTYDHYAEHLDQIFTWLERQVWG